MPVGVPAHPPKAVQEVRARQAQATNKTAPAPTSRIIKPQPGYQEAFLSSPADIVIGGGAAGAGKTFAMLMEPLRHINNRDFGAVIFRRETPQITNEGGLWDESTELYMGLRAKPNLNELSWTFKQESRVRFSHMQHAMDRFSWDGSQIPLIGFDQLESFEEIQFWYMLSRNRSTCGVKPYVRATTNPVPDDDPIGGWLNRLISWWIDPESGYPIRARAGVIRWFVRLDDVLHWGDTRQSLIDQFPNIPAADLQPKSFTFIPGSLSDNKILLETNPEYRANILALPLIERERLGAGNWKIKPSAGKIFNRAWFKSFLSALPTDIVTWIRYWDKAGTEGAGKRSAGVLIGKRSNGRFIVADVVKGHWGARNRETIIAQTAEADRFRCTGKAVTWIEQEPGSGGKESAENTIINLAGHTVHTDRVTGNKITRAGPFSSQAEAGNIDLLAAEWNESFLSELQAFDGAHGFMDQVDAASGAFNKAALHKQPIDFVTW